MKDLVIRKIQKKEIPDLLEEKELWSHKFLSISRHRLQSHLFNPYAKDNDTVLIIAYLRKEIVGYMGVFIDEIHFKKKSDKIAWLSTWWVDPSTKGAGIGRTILNEMYDVQDKKIGISQFTPSAKRVYDKSGLFTSLKVLQGCTVCVNYNYRLRLTNKIKVMNIFSNILYLVDNILNRYKKSKNKSYYNKLIKRNKEIQIDYLSYVSRENRDFLSKHNFNNLCKRDPVFFNFLKSYPWVQEAPIIELCYNNKKYHFSSYDYEFNHYVVQIKKSSSEIIGFIVLLSRNQQLKVLHAYFDSNHKKIISEIIIMHAIKIGSNEITTYNSDLTEEFMNNKSIFTTKYYRTRESIISKAYKEYNFDKYEFQFGDGDCSFA